jgi:glycerol uptake facilitator-like aquaporin
VPSVGVVSALLYEIVLTAALTFTSMAVATDTPQGAAAILSGGTVGPDALFGGPASRASMNPPVRSDPRS